MFNIKLSDEVDIEYLHERVKELMEDGIKLTDDIHEILDRLKMERDNNKQMVCRYGINNPDSPKQIINYLKLMDEDVVEECCVEHGKWSSKGDNLRQLAHAGIEFAVDLMTYRRSKKFVETVEGLVRAMDENNIIRPIVSTGRTNRVSYKEPALMNIPKELLWSLIVAGSEDNILISVDIKNQEPWILINMLNIGELKKMLNDNSDVGLYNNIFHKLYGKEPSEIERKELKTSWNALTYGANKRTIERGCRNIDGGKIYKYFNSIPEMKEYKQACYSKAHRGEKDVETLFGTHITADADTKSQLQRQLMDYKVQGTGTDILSLLVKHFDEKTEELGIVDKLWLYYSRHDEVILEVDKTWLENQGEEKVYSILKDIFEHRIEDWGPFRVEIKKIEQRDLFNFEEDDEEY